MSVPSQFASSDRKHDVFTLTDVSSDYHYLFHFLVGDTVCVRYVQDFSGTPTLYIRMLCGGLLSYYLL